MEPPALVLREYLRVSKDRAGREGRSPDQQHDENAETIARHPGWSLHPSPYREPTAVSASRYTRGARAEFERLLEDLEDDKFGADALALWESSRGSRRTGEWVDLIELCEKRGVKIWVTTHGRLYDPANARDRRSMLEDAVDSEYESAKTSARILRDVRASAQKGRPHGKNIYGYQRIYDPTSGQLHEVIPHPKHSLVVKEAAQRVLAGDSYYVIAKNYNERGIPQRRPAFKEIRKDYGWTAAAVKQMLTMPAYAGLRQHQGQVLDGVETLWPAIINIDDWNKLQSVMAVRGTKRPENWQATHLLAGIARCGVCGAGTRVGKQNAGRAAFDENGNKLPRQSYKTYLCVGIPGKTGFHVAMREEHLDLLTTTVVLLRVQQPDFLARIGQQDGTVDAERGQLLEQISTHQTWLEKVRERAATEQNLDLLFDQEARVMPLIKEAQKKLVSLAATDPLIIDLAGSDDVEARWEQLDLLQKRQIIRLLVVPLIHRVPRGTKGRKGINPDRVEWVWL